MKVYLVGGAVRDALLGREVVEKDYVVVGGTVEALLQQGFKQVGKAFPVFLHPQTHEEYALARTEKKVGAGYHGFSFVADPSVTLEQDLARRDLTINAIAKTQTGEIIDPYHGVADLNNRILRHVSDAFIEDPVRLLRIARFLARFEYLGFHIAPETKQLLKEMVIRGETKALVAERVWQEYEKGLIEKSPHAFFETLYETGAFFDVFSVPNDFDFAKGITRLKNLATFSENGSLRMAAFLSPMGGKAHKVLEKLKAPKLVVQRLQQLYQFSPELIKPEWQPEPILKLLRCHPKILEPAFLKDFIQACFVIQDRTVPDVIKKQETLMRLENEVNAIKAEAFIQQGLSGVQLGQAIEKAWLAKIAACLS